MDHIQVIKNTRHVFCFLFVGSQSKRILKLLPCTSNLEEIEDSLRPKMHSIVEVCDGFERQQRW